MPLTLRPPTAGSRGLGGLDVLYPVAGGLLLAAAFPPLRLWPLVFVAWVPLWALLTRRDASGRPPGLRRVFAWGWLMGLTAFPVMMIWLLALSNEEVTIPGLMIPSLLLIGAYLGLFFGLAALFSSLLSRAGAVPLVLVAPLVTTLCELLRAQGPLGFPWGTAPYALARVPALLQSGAVAGFWGLLTLILLVNAALAAGLAGKRWPPAAALLLVAVLSIHGLATLRAHPPEVGGEGAGPRESLRVLVAQPDIRREIKWRPEKREQVIAMVLDHAERAVRRARGRGGFDLFVWPETVLPVRLLDEPAVLAAVQSLADSIDRPLLVGTQEGYWEGPHGDRHWVAHNSVLLIHPGGGRSPIHRKLRLVPFSERMPLQSVAPWLTDIDFGQSNFYPGEEPVLLETGAARLGCLICFESAFPDLARDFVRRGANLLVVITNDFWFGDTAGPVQHADMSILRAVENRVGVVRCANTGISFVVDAYGRVRHETATFTPAAFTAHVALGAGSTASRHPHAAVITVLASLGVFVLGGRIRRRRAAGPNPARAGQGE